MRIVFIDESYDRNVYVLCGVFLVVMKYRKFNEEFNKYLKKLCNLSEVDELKGDWLFNSRGIFKNYSMNKRAELSLKIGEFLGNSTIKKFIVGYKINYEDTVKTYLEIMDYIISKSANLTSKAGKTHKQLMVIFDERESLMEGKIHESLMLKKNEIINKYKSSCTFFDYGYSGISKNSRMLQVADFVSYFLRSYLSAPHTDDLFTRAADPRKIKLLNDFKNSIKNKLVLNKC